ncbi:DUF2795 domain-containing protein [Pseudomonas sp. BN414]|nr:DUF2795 domain-containing protein [Pseudomonas sp. BN414]
MVIFPVLPGSVAATAGESYANERAFACSPSEEVHMPRKPPTNLASFLKGMHFPAGRARMIECARQQGVPPKVMEALESLPDQEYQSMADVMQGYCAAE